jgi:hypothetical protein
MDYSFYGTDQDTLPLALMHTMQFGMTLQCLLQCIIYCDPTHGPPLMAKIDLADGYYGSPYHLLPP